MKLTYRLPSLLLCFFSTAAPSECGTACTMLACRNQLSISVVGSDGSAISSFSGQIVADGVTHDVSCDDSVNQSISSFIVACEHNGFVFEGNPNLVALSLDSADLQGTAEWSPEYATFYPNGEECGGACQTAQQTVVLGPL